MKRIICLFISLLILLPLFSCSHQRPLLQSDPEDVIICFEYAYYEYDGKTVKRISNVERAASIENRYIEEYEEIKADCEFFTNFIDNREALKKTSLSAGIRSDGFALAYNGGEYCVMYDTQNDRPVLYDGSGFYEIGNSDFVDGIKNEFGYMSNILITEDKERSDRFFYKLYFFDYESIEYYIPFDEEKGATGETNRYKIEYALNELLGYNFNEVDFYRDDDAEMWCAYYSCENTLDWDCFVYIDYNGVIKGIDYTWSRSLIDGYPELDFISQRILKMYDAYYVRSIALELEDKELWIVSSSVTPEEGKEDYYVLSIVKDNVILKSKAYSEDPWQSNYDNKCKELLDEYEAEKAI